MFVQFPENNLYDIPVPSNAYTVDEKPGRPINDATLLCPLLLQTALSPAHSTAVVLFFGALSCGEEMRPKQIWKRNVTLFDRRSRI